MEKWAVRIKVLVISGVFASIANWIATTKAGKPIYPHEVAYCILLMFAIVVAGCLLDDLVQKTIKINVPTIVYISLLTVGLSIPGFSPIAGFMDVNFTKMGLLPLCTPILAYAGIAIGKDLDEFKKQGLAIMCTACLTFVGTYLGSAIIAQLVLKSMGTI